ncbi:MAG: hypothetical protein HQM10_14700 [Candidatus Riflebacteria bacterium]|nr:hypothetical protein [Candidatus Riflebacteria bacterium]
MKRLSDKQAVTLMEILLAVAILAISFIPIIATMGTSIKATQRDETIVKAIHLAQTRMNTALQFPFYEIASYPGGGGNGPWNLTAATTGLPYKNTSHTGDLTLDLSNVTMGQTTFTTSLRIENVPVKFRVKTYDPILRRANPTNPNNWGWTAYTSPNMSTIFQKYLLVVRWTDSNGNPKFYSVAAYKAKSVD